MLTRKILSAKKKRRKFSTRIISLGGKYIVAQNNLEETIRGNVQNYKIISKKNIRSG